ncbi:MAG: helix-turn-helix transcriptional regulator [Candidatus Pelethousia sp.]|nr:helix-turn-helix transcriptional regulator [Candidatus Pelethousia sp.]
MRRLNFLNKRLLSNLGFSLLAAYLLSFTFEGQVLYGLLDFYDVNAAGYILAAIAANLGGLLFCGYLVRSPKAAWRMILGSTVACVAATVPFFFKPSLLWMAGLPIGAFAGGCAVGTWGYFLKTFTPKNQRIRSCADVLICSNILMIVINVTATHVSPWAGLTMSALSLVAGGGILLALPLPEKADWRKDSGKLPGNIKKPLAMLCVFIAVITINSGLMYQVMNPAFAHLAGLASWYWAVPYILMLGILRSLPVNAKRAPVLYIGMGMIMLAFICFMLLGRNACDYLIVDTLMLGACGIFDLFWWSILGEMLDYTPSPVHVFGIGLGANVFGVLLGGAVGMGITSFHIAGAEVAVVALSVVCITLAILPPLNRQLTMLLKSHVYLAAYSGLSEIRQETILCHTIMQTALTGREKEVLAQILLGKSNKEIAAALFISENTVKTHTRNLYAKYDVGSRAELISFLLKNQIAPK